MILMGPGRNKIVVFEAHYPTPTDALGTHHLMKPTIKKLSLLKSLLHRQKSVRELAFTVLEYVIPALNCLMERYLEAWNLAMWFHLRMSHSVIVIYQVLASTMLILLKRHYGILTSQTYG